MSVDISAIPHIASHARVHGEKTAIIYEGRALSYTELHRLCGQYAAALRADGVGPGDRIAYLGVNSLTFLTTYFASIWVGAAFVPLNFRLAPAEVRTVLEDCRPDIVVAEPAHVSAIDPQLGDLGARRLLMVDDDEAITVPVDTASLTAPWQSFQAFRTAHAASVPPPVPVSDDDLAALLYTSGTTGRSKGVMLTHGNLWWNWVNVDQVVDTRVGDVSLAVAPLFHIGGFNALSLRTLTRGGTLVIRRSFDPAQALADLVNFKVNSMFLVPAMLDAIRQQEGFPEADLSHLRSTIVAGSPVPPALIALYAEKGVYLQQSWGLTETAPFATYLESGKTNDKLGSCGIPMPYTRVKVMNPDTMRQVTKAGETGEFWVSGPNVSRGYWNNPEATEKSFTPDGWFRTGDLGYADEEGYFFIIDRLKDMVISGGENIYPAEIENVLTTHPLIADVAVIGVPDAKWGEAVCAVVALREGELGLEELRAFAGEKLARYKLPTRLVIQDSIPRNGVGKLDKPLIRTLVHELDTARLITTPSASFTEAMDLTAPEAAK